MNLVEQAENDLSFTLEDKTNGFGIDIILTDENLITYNLNGQTTDIGFFIDPGTGVGVGGRTNEINFRLSTLLALGGVIPTKEWKFQYVDVNGVTQNYAIELIHPDRKIGIIKMSIGILDVS